MTETILIIQNIAFSLGVGGSTIALLNFFTAIWPGKMDPEARRMMGVTYFVLRVAMGLILITTLYLAVTTYLQTDGISLFTFQILLIIAVLIINAILMTLHKIPMTIGPAIQAGAWYTMGLLSSFRLIKLELNFLELIGLFVCIAVLLVILISYLLRFIKRKNASRPTEQTES